MILVGGLEHNFHFSIYWECHFIPADELHHFFRGVGFKPPTRIKVDIPSGKLFNITMEMSKNAS